MLGSNTTASEILVLDKCLFSIVKIAICIMFLLKILMFQAMWQ